MKLENERTLTRAAVAQPLEDISERCLLLTDDGKLGIGAASTEMGDSIWAILGCSPPIVLRANSSNQHQVVGSAIVEGLMTGEAFLGPLSAFGNIRLMFKRESGAICLCYKNESTGEVIDIDPRFNLLSGLPAEKRRLLKTRQDWNDSITIEVLRQSGVEIAEIDLV